MKIRGAELEIGLRPCMKKAMIVHAKQIPVPFEVDSMEGMVFGKAFDYLMRGVKGEYYICDKSIFEATYDWMRDADECECGNH